MAIIESELKEYCSSQENSDGGTLDAAREIDTNGKISGTTNLFPAITSEEASNGVTKYRKVFRKNNNSTDTWQDVKTWISLQINIDGADRVFIAKEGAAGDTEPPATWYQPNSKAHADVLGHGNIVAGAAFGLWMKLELPAGTSPGTYSLETISEGITS